MSWWSYLRVNKTTNRESCPVHCSDEPAPTLGTGVCGFTEPVCEPSSAPWRNWDATLRRVSTENRGAIERRVGGPDRKRMGFGIHPCRCERIEDPMDATPQWLERDRESSGGYPRVAWPRSLMGDEMPRGSSDRISNRLGAAIGARAPRRRCQWSCNRGLRALATIRARQPLGAKNPNNGLCQATVGGQADIRVRISRCVTDCRDVADDPFYEPLVGVFASWCAQAGRHTIRISAPPETSATIDLALVPIPSGACE